MNTPDYRFSIEEVAALLAISGRKDLAKGILLSNFGELSPEEERGRLLAANHSLYVHGHVSIQGEQQEITPEISRLLSAFANPTRTLRAGKTGSFGEDLRIFFYSEGSWTENAVQDGVIFSFQPERSLEEIEASILAFFSPVFLGWRKSDPVILSETLTSELTSEKRRSYEAVLAFINTTAAEHPFSDMLARDFAEARWRGSLLWMESENNEDIGMRGTLLVQGADRLWMINSTTVDGKTRMEAQLCSLAHFRKHIHDFVRSDQAPRREI